MNRLRDYWKSVLADRAGVLEIHALRYVARAQAIRKRIGHDDRAEELGTALLMLNEGAR